MEAPASGNTPAAPVKKPRASRAHRAPALRRTDEPALVLHTWPYKETSLIVDAFSRRHGRVALVARGAKRPHSALRGLLQGFQPLALSWTGSAKGGELHTLTRAEWLGGMAPLRGEALLCGFYLNELIIKLLARDDPHEALFDAYVRALANLAGGMPVAPTLRGFERILLREAGYGVELKVCTGSGVAIEAGASYRYLPEQGPVRIHVRSEGQDPQVFTGKTLLDIDADDYSDPVTLAQSKLLMRQLLQHHLAGQPLFTRQMIMDLQNI